MTRKAKAYIVANNEQELDILNKFEEKGLVWVSGDNATDWVPSEIGLFSTYVSFPYVLIEKESKKIAWLAMEQLIGEDVVYDGREE